MLHGNKFDALIHHDWLLGLLIGLMFCPDADTGYNPTIRVDTDTTGKSIHYIMAGGTKYYIIKLLLCGNYICGRGTIVWRAVSADCVNLDDELYWMTIKDV